MTDAPGGLVVMPSLRPVDLSIKKDPRAYHQTAYGYGDNASDRIEYECNKPNGDGQQTDGRQQD